MTYYRPRQKIALVAHRFDGTNFEFLYDWGCQSGEPHLARIVYEGAGANPGLLTVYAHRGPMDCPKGHWIVQGITGEFFPMSHEDFTATYEPIEEM